MSGMEFDDDPLGVQFNSLPPANALAADNIVSQTQQQEEEEEEPGVPTPPRSASNVTPPSGHHPPQTYAMSDLTTVDGHGMWTSWTRVFDQPRYALFDLLDNCLDATLHPPEFDGKVHMKRLHPNGLVILNNSSKPIKPLKDVLVVYGSTKGVGRNKKEDAIGENGVGLKHGCATLSNTSFVLSRNQNVFSLGVIAKTLQTRQGVCLPSFEFVIEDPDDKSPAEIETVIREHLEEMISQNPKVAKCVEIDLGNGELTAGLGKLIDHCQVMWDEKWEQYDHVFQVLICSLLHTHSSHTEDDPTATRRSFQGNNPAAMFLNMIKQQLPRFYINIPLKGFEFMIENERVQFSYWQHRLVELTKFTVHIPKEQPIQDINHMNWETDGYPLSVYAGFEAQRVADYHQANAAHMYIYSRASGRLIQIDDDARATLGLAASGSDYQQGLTLIVDDVTAQLPLMPTKQGIAWSEQRGGEIHKRNLLAWVAGVAQCYWNHHAKTFGARTGRSDVKSLLQSAVQDMVDPIKRHLHDLDQAQRSNRQSNNPQSTLNRSLAMERLELADFTWFRNIDWKKTQNRANKKWKITKSFGTTSRMTVVPGSATIFKFTAEHYPQPPRAIAAAAPPVPSRVVPSQAAQLQASVAASVANATKKRRLSNGGSASKPILCLDDDSDGSAGAPVVAQNGIRRQVARKSTGAPSPQDMMRGHGSSYHPPQQHRQAAPFIPPQANHNPHLLQLQNRLRAAEAEMQRNRTMVVRLQQELQRAQQHNQQLQQQNQYNQAQQNPNHQPPPDYQANMQRAQDELTIAKRQKNKLEGDLQEVKEQRATEVSGLNLEIEGLRMKLEQQEETIRALRQGSQENEDPDGRGSFTSPIKLHHGTDSI